MICQNEDSVCGFLIRKKFADVVVDFTFPLYTEIIIKHYLLIVYIFLSFFITTTNIVIEILLLDKF